MVAGRAVILAWFEAMATCMDEGGDKERLLKLFEARLREFRYIDYY